MDKVQIQVCAAISYSMFFSDRTKNRKNNSFFWNLLKCLQLTSTEVMLTLKPNSSLLTDVQNNPVYMNLINSNPNNSFQTSCSNRVSAMSAWPSNLLWIQTSTFLCPFLSNKYSKLHKPIVANMYQNLYIKQSNMISINFCSHYKVFELTL